VQKARASQNDTTTLLWAKTAIRTRRNQLLREGVREADVQLGSSVAVAGGAAMPLWGSNPCDGRAIAVLVLPTPAQAERLAVQGVAEHLLQC
jgi:hypothetical protein